MSTLSLTTAHASLAQRLDRTGQWLAPLGLRVILAWEFFEAGREKLFGVNWFAELTDKFPLPFSVLDPSVNWAMATWIELVGAVALLLGVGTRYAAFALLLLTLVAIDANAVTQRRKVGISAHIDRMLRASLHAGVALPAHVGLDVVGAAIRLVDVHDVRGTDVDAVSASVAPRHVHEGRHKSAP